MWRGPSMVQIGLDPRRGLILDGLTDEDAAVLHRLFLGADSTALDTGADSTEATGRSRPRSRQLVRLLAEADVLNRVPPGRSAPHRLDPHRHRLVDDAQVWSVVHPGSEDGWELLNHRGRRHVQVHGGGRIGTALAATLAAAGVGSVEVLDSRPVRSRDLAPAGPLPADLGSPQHRAARSAANRLAVGDSPDPRNDPGADSQNSSLPDIVVLLEHGAADARRADEFSIKEIPQLSVVVQEASTMVGPLVLPGHSACLRCLDLHRTDLDASWPVLLAQLTGHRDDRPGVPEHHAEETASAGLVASLAALQILHHLDGLPADNTGRGDTSIATMPAAVGATLTVQLPDGLITRQEWQPHAECGCHWLPLSSATHRTTRAEGGRTPQLSFGTGRMSP